MALVIVPVISVAVRKFGRFLRELSHQTQAAAAVASSIAEVCISDVLFVNDHTGIMVKPFFSYSISLPKNNNQICALSFYFNHRVID